MYPFASPRPPRLLCHSKKGATHEPEPVGVHGSAPDNRHPRNSAHGAASGHRDRLDVDNGRVAPWRTRPSSPCCSLVSLSVLVGGFEAIHALNVGVERIGRYLQVYYEGTAGRPDRGRPPRWPSARRCRAAESTRCSRVVFSAAGRAEPGSGISRTPRDHRLCRGPPGARYLLDPGGSRARGRGRSAGRGPRNLPRHQIDAGVQVDLNGVGSRIGTSIGFKARCQRNSQPQRPLGTARRTGAVERFVERMCSSSHTARRQSLSREYSSASATFASVEPHPSVRPSPASEKSTWLPGRSAIARLSSRQGGRLPSRR